MSVIGLQDILFMMMLTVRQSSESLVELCRRVSPWREKDSPVCAAQARRIFALAPDFLVLGSSVTVKTSLAFVMTPSDIGECPISQEILGLGGANTLGPAVFNQYGTRAMFSCLMLDTSTLNHVLEKAEVLQLTSCFAPEHPPASREQLKVP